MIEARELTKRFGSVTAVAGLTFTVKPGQVTGFLGPNGAGKSTTLRMILGLNAPTSGTATIDGRPFRLEGTGLRRVGALLDAGDVHKGRSAQAHLAALARSNGIPGERVTAVLREVGLSDAARRRVGGFSLGMRQRLGIAAALLGDPPVLIFDEPINGLDPEGIRWAREFFRRLALEGRTVLVSSHLMSEMEHTADHLIVVGAGKLHRRRAAEPVRGAGDPAEGHCPGRRSAAPVRRAHRGWRRGGAGRGWGADRHRIEYQPDRGGRVHQPDHGVRGRREVRCAGRRVHGADGFQRRVPHRELVMAAESLSLQRAPFMRRRARFGDLCAAEWIKLWSLRSTPIMLGVGVTLALYLAGRNSAGGTMLPSGLKGPVDPNHAAFDGPSWVLAMIGAGMTGALALVGEHTSGLIRTTLLAVPRRRQVVVAKAAVVPPP